jgi:hypothetical protein
VHNARLDAARLFLNAIKNITKMNITSRCEPKETESDVLHLESQLETNKLVS